MQTKRQLANADEQTQSPRNQARGRGTGRTGGVAPLLSAILDGPFDAACTMEQGATPGFPEALASWLAAPLRTRNTWAVQAGWRQISTPRPGPAAPATLVALLCPTQAPRRISMNGRGRSAGHVARRPALRRRSGRRPGVLQDGPQRPADDAALRGDAAHAVLDRSPCARGRRAGPRWRGLHRAIAGQRSHCPWRSTQPKRTAGWMRAFTPQGSG